MALGDLTKQLAEQALEAAVRSPKPAAAGQPENACATILGQVQAMQKALKEDEELLVQFHTGAEMIRVLEFYAPSWQVLVLKGVGADRNLIRVVAPVESLRLVCKVVKAQPGAKPNRIGFVTPKPRPE